MVVPSFQQKALPADHTLVVLFSSFFGKQVSKYSKTIYFHMHIYISKFHYAVDIRLFYLAPIKNSLKI